MVLQKHSNQKREIIASLMKLPDTQPVSPEQAQSHRVQNRLETAEQAKALGLILVEEPSAEVSGSRSGLRRRVHPMG